MGKRIIFDDVELQCFAASPRCAITMQEQGSDIPRDPGILRTIVKHADQNLGVYCMVTKQGKINTGDNVNIA